MSDRPLPTSAPPPPHTPPASGPRQLAPNLIAARVDGGRLAENVLYFVRLLRASGMKVGPERTVLATEAAIAVGIEDPKRLYWALHAALVTRRAERDIFNQAYVMFWKDPGYLEQMLSLMLPSFKPAIEAEDRALSRRLSEGLFKNQSREAPKADEILEIDAVGSFSVTETLRTKDFEQMSVAELARVRRALQAIRLPDDRLLTRRYEQARRGRLDMRRMLREQARLGGEHIALAHRARITRRPPLVVVCDISGSMDTYARILLHFVYAITNERRRVSVFLFGTRLTNVTRTLVNRDPDAAIARVGRDVTDWSGGTRIGAALETFNKRWARRVLGQNATVLLITDGLDREGGEGIDAAARRLRASCRRLVWLNPLMRYAGYEPVAAGAAALARHASEVRACHSLASLDDLVAALAR